MDFDVKTGRDDGSKPTFIHWMRHVLDTEQENAKEAKHPELIPVEIMARLARHAIDLARDQEKQEAMV